MRSVLPLFSLWKRLRNENHFRLIFTPSVNMKITVKINWYLGIVFKLFLFFLPHLPIEIRKKIIVSKIDYLLIFTSISPSILEKSYEQNNFFDVQSSVVVNSFHLPALRRFKLQEMLQLRRTLPLTCRNHKKYYFTS